MAPFNWAKVFLDEDSRGNRLLNVQVTRDGDDYFLDLLCVEDIADQFFAVLEQLHPVWLEPEEDWSHQIRFDGPYRQWLKDLIELLQRVLTLRTHPELDMAIALDFHTVPPAPDDVEQRWGRTAAGDLVYRKYYKNNPREVARAGSQLTDLLVEVIRAHPVYAAATRVVVVPSTNNEWKFGERLGRTVATRAGIERATAKCISSRHLQAKGGHTSNKPEPYVIDGDVSGHRVIIVDDLYLSGQTIRDIAIAARERGATQILGLAGTRALRRR